MGLWCFFGGASGDVMKVVLVGLVVACCEFEVEIMI